jgi:hypothetical protein
MLPRVISLGLKYRHSNLSVAGHSPLASESTVSASLESHAVIGPLGLHERVIINHGHNALAGLQQHTCRHKNLKGRPISNPVGSGRQMLLNQSQLA